MSIATICAFLTTNRNLPIYQGDPGSDELLREMMSITGFDAQIRQIKNLAFIGLNNYQSRLKGHEYQILKAIVSDAYRIQDIQISVVNRLKDQLESAHIWMVLEWSHTTFAKRLSRQEKLFATPETLQQFPKFESELKSTTVGKNLLESVHRIDKATRATDLAVELYLQQLWVGMVCCDALLEPIRQSGGERIRRMLAAKKDEFHQQIQKANVSRLLYVYRDFPDSDLSKYLGFLESDAGLWLHSIIYEILMHVVMDASFKLTNSLSLALPTLKKTQQQQRQQNVA